MRLCTTDRGLRLAVRSFHRGYSHSPERLRRGCVAPDAGGLETSTWFGTQRKFIGSASLSFENPLPIFSPKNNINAQGYGHSHVSQGRPDASGRPKSREYSALGQLPGVKHRVNYKISGIASACDQRYLRLNHLQPGPCVSYLTSLRGPVYCAEQRPTDAPKGRDVGKF